MKVLKNNVWRIEVIKRRIKEIINSKIKLKYDKNRKIPYVVYIIGMPRTGTSYVKNYFGIHNELKIMPFNKEGYHHTLKIAVMKNEKKIYIDKSTHNINNIKNILKYGGDKIRILVVVRDPRDQLISLLNFSRHPEISRGKKYWDQWYDKYSQVLKIYNAFSKNKKNNIKIMRYEDIVNDPILMKIKFLNWLELPSNNVTDYYEIAHENDIQDDNVLKFSNSQKNSLFKYKKTKYKYINEQLNSKKKLITLMKKYNYKI